LHNAFINHLGTQNPENKEKDVLTDDGVHLNDEENRFVARMILESLEKWTEKGATHFARLSSEKRVAPNLAYPGWGPRGIRDGRRMIAFNSWRTPSTAIPRIRNGSRKSQTIG
jgi:hypothetical protein